MFERLESIYKDISVIEENIKNPKETWSFYTHYKVSYKMIEDILVDFTKKEIKNKFFLEPSNGCGIYTFSLIEYLLHKWFDKKELEDFMNNNLLISELQEDKVLEFEAILRSHYWEYDFNIRKNIGSTLELTIDKAKELLWRDDFVWFDFIIWNPPYGFSDLIAKKNLEKKYKKLPSDIYGLFFIHCYDLLVDWGILSLITPRSFFWIKTFSWLRDILLSDIKEVYICANNIFYNPYNKLCPNIETTITVIEKKANINTYTLKNISLEETIIKGELDKSFCKMFGGVVLWNEFYDNPNKEIIANIFERKKFVMSDIMDSAMWIKTADNNKFISKKKTKKTKKYYKWSSKYSQSFTSEVEWYLDLDFLKQNKLKNTSIPQEKFLTLNKKRIGIPEIGHKWRSCAFIYEDAYVSNSIWIYQKKEGVNNQWLYVLTGLLNSTYYQEISQFYSSWFRIEKHDIDKLPIFFTEEDDIFSEIFNEVNNFYQQGKDKQETIKNIDKTIKHFLINKKE